VGRWGPWISVGCEPYVDRTIPRIKKKKRKQNKRKTENKKKKERKKKERKK
jgi:hypothetical protein